MNPKLSDAIDEFIVWRKARGRAPRTIVTDDFVLRSYLLTQVGNIRTKDLRPSHVTGLWDRPVGGGVRGNNRIVKPLAASTKNLYGTKVTAFLEWCQNPGRGYLGLDVAAFVSDMPNPKVMKRSRLRLTPSEMLTCLERAVHPRDRMILAMAINTGLRASEIASLRVKDVDVRNARLHVVIHKTQQQDVMPIGPDLMAEILRWLTFYAQEMVEKHEPVDGSMFFVPAKTAIAFRNDGTGQLLVSNIGRLKPHVQAQRLSIVAHRALATVGKDGYQEGMHTFRRSAGRAFWDLLSTQDKPVDHAMAVVQTFLHHTSVVSTQIYLGLDHEVVIRDDVLGNQGFLTQLVGDANVASLDDARRARAE